MVARIFTFGNGAGNGTAILVHVSIQPILYLDILLSLGNVLLLILLLYTYWDNYKNFKSIFNFGLIMFAVFLLLQNILLSSFILFSQTFQIAELGLPLFVLNITEFIGLLFLFIVTWR